MVTYINQPASYHQPMHFNYHPNTAPTMCQPCPPPPAFQQLNAPPAPKLIAPEFIRNKNTAPSTTFVPEYLQGASQNSLKPYAPRKSFQLDEGVQSDHSTASESPKSQPKKRTQFVKEYSRKQKTEMCKNWDMTGSCQWGSRCSYAHGAHELVKKTHLPKNFMTKACLEFHKEQYCAYGMRCQFMHAERDIYAHQSYATVLNENKRLAHAKISTVDEVDNNAQIYINVFERKSRLSCFEGITGGDKDDFLSHGSNESDRLQDFSEIPLKSAPKKKTGKAAKKRTVLFEGPKDSKKKFSTPQFNNECPKSDLKAAAQKKSTNFFNGQQIPIKSFVPTY